VFEVELTSKEKEYLDSWFENPDEATTYFGTVLRVARRMREINRETKVFLRRWDRMRKVYLSKRERKYLFNTPYFEKNKVKSKIQDLEVHIHQKKKAKYLAGLMALPEKLRRLNRHRLQKELM